MTNESYILKLKGLNQPDEYIAAKLEIPVEEVRKTWQEALERTNRVLSSGYFTLCEQFTQLCQRQKLVNESLHILGAALDNEATPSDLGKFMAPETAAQVLQEFIVLKRFTPPTPQESLQMLDGQN